MIKDKCVKCGRFSIEYKAVGKKSGDIEIPSFRLWKFCMVKKDWCKNVASHCEAYIKPENRKTIVMETLY